MFIRKWSLDWIPYQGSDLALIYRPALYYYTGSVKRIRKIPGRHPLPDAWRDVPGSGAQKSPVGMLIGFHGVYMSREPRSVQMVGPIQRGTLRDAMPGGGVRCSD